jgi:hypothetical protein
MYATIAFCVAAFGLSNYQIEQGYSPNTAIQFKAFRNYNGSIPLHGTFQEIEAIEALNGFENAMRNTLDNQKAWKSAFDYNNWQRQERIETKRDQVLNPALARACRRFSRAGRCQSSVKDMTAYPSDGETTGTSADCPMLNFKEKKTKKRSPKEKAALSFRKKK